MNLKVNLGNLHFGALREQKTALLDICKGNEEHTLTGLLHLIDHIQDEAAKQLGKTTVFGDERQ